MEESAAHMKMILPSQMSPITLKIHSWINYLMIKKMITEDPVRTKLLANRNLRTTSSVSSKKENKNQIISQIFTGVQNSSRN